MDSTCATATSAARDRRARRAGVATEDIVRGTTDGADRPFTALESPSHSESRARAGAALESLDEAAAEVRAGVDEPRGTLRVTGPTDLGVLLAPVIAEFAEAHPALRVEVELTQSTLDFEAHRIDVAFRAAAVLRMIATLGLGPRPHRSTDAPAHLP